MQKVQSQGTSRSNLKRATRRRVVYRGGESRGREISGSRFACASGVSLAMRVLENGQRRGAAAGRVEGRLGPAVGRHRMPAGSGALSRRLEVIKRAR